MLGGYINKNRIEHEYHQKIYDMMLIDENHKLNINQLAHKFVNSSNFLYLNNMI